MVNYIQPRIPLGQISKPPPGFQAWLNTEKFSCVFVLFLVMSGLFSIPLRTVNNTKTQENVSVRTGPIFYQI